LSELVSLLPDPFDRVNRSGCERAVPSKLKKLAPAQSMPEPKYGRKTM
jgi:hypothetical protein